MNTHPLYHLFQPKHLAVIGASQRPGSFGERIFSALLAKPFGGGLYAVNHKHKTVAGLPAYPHIGKIPHSIDCALILTPPDTYEAMITACRKKRVRHIVIILRPDAPPQLIGQLAQTATQLRGRLTLCSADGFSATANGLTATTARPLPATGKIALVGHSRGFYADTLHHLNGLPVGFSHHINLAAFSDQTAALIDYFQEDNASQVLLVEHSMKSDGRFFSALRQAAKRKPVILHHAAALPPEEKILLQHAAERCGALLTTTPPELRAAVRAAHTPKKHRTADLHILSPYENGWLQDQAAAHSINTTSGDWPISDGALAVRDAAAQLLADDNCRALLVDSGGNEETAHHIRQLQNQSDKPLYLISPFSDGLLNFHEPQHALLAMSAQHNLLQLKKNQQQTARPPQAALLSPPDHIEPANLLAEMHLPASGQAAESGEAVLHYAVHPHYGATLKAAHNGQNLALLPPFTTLHARQLAAFFAQRKNQTAFEQILHALNHAAYRFPALQSWQTAQAPGGNWRTTSADIRPDAAAFENLLAGYPYQSKHFFTLKNRDTVFIRPLRPEDADALQDFVRKLSDQSRQTRFMFANKELPPTLLAAFTLLDYRREAAFIACQGDGSIVGWAQHGPVRFPDACEFGISVADSMHGQGLAKHLMRQLIAFAVRQGYRAMQAEILADNQAMLKLAESLGFSIAPSPHDRMLSVANLPLNPPQPH